MNSDRGRASVPHLPPAVIRRANVLLVNQTHQRQIEPKERRWLSRWAETRVTAEFWRAEIERRFAPCSDIVRLLQ